VPDTKLIKINFIPLGYRLDIILMCWLTYKALIYSIILLFSFGLTQKKQKVKASYKFYTSVRLGKGSQNKAYYNGYNILTAREADVLLRTCPRFLPSATVVAKFL